MNMYELKRLFHNRKLDKLYIGCVTVYKPKIHVLPDFVKVSVPEGKEYVKYTAIMERCGEDCFSQIDNGQLILYSNESCEFSNFPIVTKPIKLIDFYNNFYSNKIPFNLFTLLVMKNRILKDSEEKGMVL